MSATKDESVTRPALRALADLAGIIPEYLDQTGKETRVTRDATRIAFLAAMGLDAPTEERAEGLLAALRAEREARALDTVRVVRVGSPEARALPVRGIAHGAAGRWSLTLRMDSGAAHHEEGELAALAGGTLALPDPLPLGYHVVRLAFHPAQGEAHTAEQLLLVVPPTCVTPHDVVGAHRIFGVVANLYTVRSARNWGVGDFTDLAELAEWCASMGAAFVGVNPLHALRNRDHDVSPYSPVSRLFRNAIYVDVEAVPELARAPETRAWLASPAVQGELATLREAAQIDYTRVAALKREALDPLHEAFRSDAASDDPADPARAAAYRAYVAEHEPALSDFARWMARDELGGRLTGDDVDRRVDFHRWLQFELDRQLAAAALRAREAGMPIGLYQDLAIGASPSGSDTETDPTLFLKGVSVGAPPDPYAAQGQNWGLPPIDPRRLRAERFAYWVRLLRAAFRHAGALRIDHVMGLFRLFWIPEGETGQAGAYMAYPSEELLGILALESARHGAIVVGEDLGTVPPDVPPALERWHVLGSKVLYFERDGERFRPPSEYDARSLATANTHDMATLAGFVEARDVLLRIEHGLAGDQSEEEGRAGRAREVEALRTLLRDAKLPDDPDDGAAFRGAVHTVLARTPAMLVGLSLDDLAGETEPVNLPGVGPDQYPSWRRRMTRPLEELREAEDVRIAFGEVPALRGVGRAGTRPGATQQEG